MNKTKRRSRKFLDARVCLYDNLNSLYGRENAYFKASAIRSYIKENFNLANYWHNYFDGIIYERTRRWYEECVFLYIDADGVPIENQKDYERIHREELKGEHFWYIKDKVGLRYAIEPVSTPHP
tara:strand:- start:15105 stop:15476 length:372 start_codon:yes stop_codon:yes gene_type:complete